MRRSLAHDAESPRSGESGRRRWPALALGVVAAVTVIACAHPNEVPRPGQTVAAPPSTTRPVVTTGADETKTVCSQAQSLNDAAIADLTRLLSQAQSAKAANDTAAALTAVTNAQKRAKEWSSGLDALTGKNISSRVRTALQSGITTINKLANAPLSSLATIDPEQVQKDITKFRDDLRTACA
jgi:paraquat-inducible protein B